VLRIVAASIVVLLVLGAVPSAFGIERASQSDSSVYRTGVDEAGAERYLALLDDVGADAQRVSLRWGQIAASCGADGIDIDERRDPDAGCYDWSKVDHAVDGGPAETYLTVRELPCWLHRDCAEAADGGSFVGRSDAELATFTAELGAFLTAATERYGDRVHHWTIWNEPNGKDFWSEQPEAEGPQPELAVRACHFVDTYTSIVGELRRDPANADLRFAFGPLAPSSSRQPVAYLEAAAACLNDVDVDVEVDALALHAYPGDAKGDPYGPCASWDPSGVLDRRSTSLQCLGRLRTWLDARDDELLTPFAGAPLWVLETAYEDIDDDPALGIDPLQQARFYSLALERVAEAGASVLSWYPAVDGSHIGDWQSGLMKANAQTRRPIALTFQAPLAVRRLPDGSWRAWTSAGATTDATILVSERCDHAADAPAAERYDFEQAASVSRNGDSVTATFDELPVDSCLAVGSGSTPLTSAVIGMRAPSGGSVVSIEPYLVSARVIDDAARDPRGDVLIEGSDGRAQVGNPTGQAIWRALLLDSNEPIRIDPTLGGIVLD
jgi:hypothetical protein